MRSLPRHHRHPLRAAALCGLLLLAACGSQLTEEQVLARAGVATNAAGVPDGSPVTGSVAPGSAIDEPAGGSTDPRQPQNSPGAALPGGASGGDTQAPDQTAPADGAASAGAACTTSDTAPVVIGNVGNYSGPAGVAVGQMPRGLRMWAAAINSRGGLCGREVQVIVQDDGGDPARYGSLVRDLVENRGISAFVGNGAPLSAQGGLSYHRDSGVPVIGTDCTTGFWFDSPVLFPACATPTVVLTGAVANGVALSGKTSFAYLYCTEAQGCLDADRIFREGAVSNAGAEIVYRKSISITQVDFTAECQSARDKGAALFYVGADPATLQRVTQSCARQNYFPQYISVSVTWSADSLPTKGLTDVALSMATMPFTGGSGGAIDEYQAALDTFAPGTKPGPALALGWIAGKLFEVAATRAADNDGTITPKALIDALYAFDGETLGGLSTPLRFGPDGARNANCYFTMQGDGTGTGYHLPNGTDPVCL